jgi:hypothetical protein
VIELLAYGERDPITIVQSTPPGREDGTLGPLPQSLISPSVTLDQLELRRAGKDGENPQREAELHRGYARLRLGHQGPSASAGAGTA